MSDVWSAWHVATGIFAAVKLIPPERVDEDSRRALEREIVGGLEMGRFYSDLDGAMLVCATEMNTREEIERFAEVFAV